MSFEYRPFEEIRLKSLSDDRFRKYGIEVEPLGRQIHLSGSDGVLVATRDHSSIHLEHKGGQFPTSAFRALMTEFDTEI